MMHVGDIMSTVGGVQCRLGKIFCYLSTPEVLNIPYCTQDIPHMHHDTLHGTSHPNHGTAHPPRYRVIQGGNFERINPVYRVSQKNSIQS